MRNLFARFVDEYRYDKFSTFLRRYKWNNDGTFQSLYSVWHRPNRENYDLEVVAPISSTLKDMREVLTAALETLAIFFQKEPERVLMDFFNEQSDKLNIRLVSDKTRDGKIPLEEGVNLIESSRELILASFLSTYRAKKNFPGQRPDFITEFIEKVELGQTEEGSFIINLYVPNNLEHDGTATLGLDKSFTRRSVDAIHESIVALNQKVAEFEVSRDVTIFDQIVEKGVSSNLCFALCRMSSEGESDINISITETADLTDQDVELVSRVSKADIPTIKTVAEYYRRDVTSPSTKLIGYVTHLHQEKDAVEGDITLSTFSGTVVKRVKITLGKDFYQKAIQAHTDRLLLSCTGTLIQQERRTLMTDVSAVEIIEEED